MAQSTTTAKKAVAKKTIAKRPRPAAAAKVASTAKQHPVVGIAGIPDKRYSDEYLNRKFHKHSDFDVFQKAMDNRWNILIEGPTGPGKTSAALAFAAKKRMRFYAIPSNIGIEPSQLFGKHIPNPAGGFVWQDGPVTDIIRNGGFLLVNEVNFMPERVATVLFGLLDKRREIVLLDHKGETVRAHWGKGTCWCDEADCNSKRVLVAADMNPEYEGTRPLNKAFRNRFAVQLFWDYDSAIERQLVKSESLVLMAEQFRSDAAKGDFETPVATNMLQEFEQVYTTLGIDFAIDNFVNHFLADERSAADQIVRTWQANIEGDLEYVVDEGDDDEKESDEDEVPDDWGVEGVDWVYEDEDE